MEFANYSEPLEKASVTIDIDTELTLALTQSCSIKAHANASDKMLL